ncbi:MFS transporter [Streptomyces sp. NBC_01016]|uniref:MFS transporter n=1 Tax=Streptomyces sp. NBC_01016 TaxID=2903720 RepID=UPI00224C97E6|nr:MFS transporter [Streptomyces sp. NBC_01016]MCX4834668.1 MFS transporter [Streptomyces sp. NBC_01016]
MPALIVLALGAFVLGTSELAIAGLLPAISADLEISSGAAGTLVSAYAVAVALLGPVLTATTSHLSRRQVLVGASVALAVGNGVTAVATHFPALLVARALTGTAAAMYAATALTVATTLTGPERRGRAVAVVFAGITVSAVVGVPASTLLGDVFGWRAVYGALSALTVGVLTAAVRLVPEPPPEPASSLSTRLKVLAKPRLLVTFSVNALVTAGHYTAFTYLVTLLTQQTDLSTTTASILLLTSGVSGTVGTLVGGTAADRHTRRALVTSVALLATSLIVIPLVMTSPVLIWLVALLWAAAFNAFSTTAQVNVSLQAHPATDIAAAANISAFNAGIAGGSAAGGVVLHSAGFTGVALTGAALAGAGLIAALLLPVVRTGR